MATKLRLANGSTRCEGRVEVTHDGTWAALCDEGWGLAEAQVVCRQLGCGKALSAPGGSHFGQGPGQTWPNSVSCVGTETALSACKVKPRGNGTCHHGREAGVVCAGNPLGSDTAQEVVGLGPSPLFSASASSPGQRSFFVDFSITECRGLSGGREKFWVSSWRGRCQCQWVGCCCGAACSLSPLSQQALGTSQLLFVVIRQACSTWCNTQ